MSSSDALPAGSTDAASGAVPAQVQLSSRIASLELSIVASDFRPLASGVGSLSATVPAGIYQLVARAGPTVERKLIRLDPGAVYSDMDVSVRFPAPAPVSETSTSHEYQQDAVQQAAGIIGQMPGPPSGLVIVVRDVRGYDGPPLEPGDISCFDLLDQGLSHVPGFGQGWVLKAGEAVATWSGRLAPGGYALRTDPSRGFGTTRRSSSTQAFDQSLWLSANWQTIVFITTGAGGPQTATASVHMTQLGMGWDPHDTNVGFALELANWGLREGRSVLPKDLLNVLLNTKFVNPMLGIVGAHSLLLSSDIEPGVLETVLGNLENMVPGHPDVIALRWMAVSRSGATDGPPTAGGHPASMPPGGATWPPMLLPSYRALVAMDAAYPRAVADGSPAERAAASLLIQGIWTNWSPLPQMAPPPPEPREPPPPMSAPPRRRGGGIRQPGRAGPVTSVAVLPTLGRDPSLIERLPVDDPATARVVAYLGALAALEGPNRREARFAGLSSQEIALATTLPVATVDRSLSRIGAALVPTGGSGGGGGALLPGAAALIAAAVLVLGGALGAAAWCASNEQCPIRIVAIDPSDPPPTASVEPTSAPEETEPPETPPPTDPPETSPPTNSPSPTAFLLEHPSLVEFGSVTIGNLPAQQQLTVTGPEQVPLSFTISDNPDEAFAVDPTCAWTDSTSALPGCTVQVSFMPRRETDYVGTVSVFAGDELEPRPVQLTGLGVPLFLRFPKEITFDNATIGDSPAVASLELFASDDVPVDFAVVDGVVDAFEPLTPCVWLVGPSGLFECSVDLQFTPLFEDEHSATLQIITNEAEAEPRLVRLVGRGFFRVD